MTTREYLDYSRKVCALAKNVNEEFAEKLFCFLIDNSDVSEKILDAMPERVFDVLVYDEAYVNKIIEDNYEDNEVKGKTGKIMKSAGNALLEHLDEFNDEECMRVTLDAIEEVVNGSKTIYSDEYDDDDEDEDEYDELYA